MTAADTRTEHIETITLRVYSVPGMTPHEDILAAAWEKAETAAAELFAAYGWPVRVEQER